MVTAKQPIAKHGEARGEREGFLKGGARERETDVR
jgi:hypothetical protein